MGIFIDVVKDSINEIKAYKNMIGSIEAKKEKAKYFSLLYFNILFLFVYLVPIVCFVYLIGVSYFVGPSIILGLIMCFLFILFILFVRTKAYPAMRENYLKKER